MATIIEPGVIAGLPILEYVKDPAPAPSLSASIAHTLLTKSARHAWFSHPRLNREWQPDEATRLDVGTIAHAMLLEKDESRVVAIDAPDWKSKAARIERDAVRADGKLPVLADALDEIRAMVTVARRAIAGSELAEMLTSGQVEQTIVWREGDVWCRCRPDWLSEDARILADYKTTGASAEPDAWSRGLMLAMGYDVQAAFGLRAARVLLKPTREPSFVFIVQEVDPPYAVSFVGLSPEFEAFADDKRREALATWTTCMTTDTWPSYPSRIAWAEPPAWAITRFHEHSYLASGSTGRDGEGTVDDL